MPMEQGAPARVALIIACTHYESESPAKNAGLARDVHRWQEAYQRAGVPCVTLRLSETVPALTGSSANPWFSELNEAIGKLEDEVEKMLALNTKDNVDCWRDPEVQVVVIGLGTQVQPWPGSNRVPFAALAHPDAKVDPLVIGPVDRPNSLAALLNTGLRTIDVPRPVTLILDCAFTSKLPIWAPNDAVTRAVSTAPATNVLAEMRDEDRVLPDSLNDIPISPKAKGPAGASFKGDCGGDDDLPTLTTVLLGSYFSGIQVDPTDTMYRSIHITQQGTQIGTLVVIGSQAIAPIGGGPVWQANSEYWLPATPSGNSVFQPPFALVPFFEPLPTAVGSRTRENRPFSADFSAERGTTTWKVTVTGTGAVVYTSPPTETSIWYTKASGIELTSTGFMPLTSQKPLSFVADTSTDNNKNYRWA